MPTTAYSAVISSVTLNGTAVIYSNSISIASARFVAVKIKAVSATGTADVQVDWQASDVLPAGEGGADTNYVIPDDMSIPFVSLNDEIFHVKQIYPPPTTYGRLKVTGNAGNPSDTVVDAGIFLQI